MSDGASSSILTLCLSGPVIADWDAVVGDTADVKMVLFLDCSMEDCTKRVLARARFEQLHSGHPALFLPPCYRYRLSVTSLSPRSQSRGGQSV